MVAVVMCAVLLGSRWDSRRGQRITEASVRDVHASAERIEQSAERIAQLTVEVLRRTPEREDPSLSLYKPLEATQPREGIWDRLWGESGKFAPGKQENEASYHNGEHA